MIELFKKRYTHDYKCSHFFVDAANKLHGKDLSKIMEGFLYPKKKSNQNIRHDFKLIDKPEEPCMVMFHGKQPADPHVGLYIDGGVLHLTALGVFHQSLEVASIGFQSVRFYKWN